VKDKQILQYLELEGWEIEPITKFIVHKNTRKRLQYDDLGPLFQRVHEDGFQAGLEANE
jgi:hypothetical protein